MDDHQPGRIGEIFFALTMNCYQHGLSGGLMGFFSNWDCHWFVGWVRKWKLRPPKFHPQKFMNTLFWNGQDMLTYIDMIGYAMHIIKNTSLYLIICIFLWIYFDRKRSALVICSPNCPTCRCFTFSWKGFALLPLRRGAGYFYHSGPCSSHLRPLDDCFHGLGTKDYEIGSKGDSFSSDISCARIHHLSATLHHVCLIGGCGMLHQSIFSADEIIVLTGCVSGAWLWTMTYHGWWWCDDDDDDDDGDDDDDDEEEDDDDEDDDDDDDVVVVVVDDGDDGDDGDDDDDDHYYHYYDQHFGRSHVFCTEHVVLSNLFLHHLAPFFTLAMAWPYFVWHSWQLADILYLRCWQLWTPSFDW